MKGRDPALSAAKALCFLMALCAGAAADAASKPQRVVSINLCADQMLMMTADPANVASVSWMAADPRSSLMVLEAQKYPLNRAAAEDIIALKPDLILAGAYEKAETVSLLRKLGYRVETFAAAANVEDIRANFLKLGAVLGEPDRARAIIDEIDANTFAQTEPSPPDAPLFSNYDVNGWVNGQGSLIDDLARRAGFRTIGESLNFAGMRYISLEHFIAAAPDVVALGDPWADPPALATQSLRHPALKRFLRSRRAISIDPTLLVCGLPQSLAVLNQLRDARAAFD